MSSERRTRREFVRRAAQGAALLAAGCVVGKQAREDDVSQTTNEGQARQPVVFVGHGSPMNVIEDTPWGQEFARLGRTLTRPRAILAISAHWFVGGTLLTAGSRPKTIHDFGGFPQALYEIDYPAPGHVDLAKRVRGLLGEERAGLSSDWGLDHGTWSVLHWMYPQADVPVIQLSIDRRLEMRDHYELGRSLAGLREEGVLILASGNVTHNLGDAMGRARSGNLETPEWAQTFDRSVAKALEQRDTDALVGFWPDSEHGRQAHPSPDHWIPLLYAYGASEEADPVRFSSVGFDLGSLSMRNVVFG